jgi:UDP:flavonoid glycosyltransferase YjiC (YdhE family)
VTQYRQLVEASLGDDVMHYNFAHFPSLMPLMCVIIHHGGIGTTGQAVASGVPQLVMAEMTDGPDNARRLRRIGIAEYLPKLRWTAEFVAEALRHLCASPSVKEKCCHYSKLMADNDPLAVACDAIENFISGDRHSYQEI